MVLSAHGLASVMVPGVSKLLFAAPLVVLALLFGPASFGQTADRIDVEQNFVFEDAAPAGALREIPVPWTDAEKDEVTRCLRLAAAGVPGAVQSALNGKTISIYRIYYPLSPSINPTLRRNSEVHAYSIRVDKHNQGRCQIYICDRFFSSDLDTRGFDQHAWVIAHELGHLSDPGNRLDDSDEWKRLVRPRIIQARLLATSNMSWSAQDELCLRCGLPSRVAAQNTHEALAEFIASRCFNPEFQPSPEIEKMLDERIFHTSPPAKTLATANIGELVEQCHQDFAASQEQVVEAGLKKHDTNERLARRFYKDAIRSANHHEIQKAISNYELAVCLDKDNLQYQKALSAARFESGFKLQQQQNLKGALIQFRKAVEADPQNYLASSAARTLAPKVGRFALSKPAPSTVVDSYALQTETQPAEEEVRPTVHASLLDPSRQ